MYDLILKNFHLLDKDVINVYPYGSRVYGTFSDKSDYDFIVIRKSGDGEFALSSDDNSMNVHLYSYDAFMDQVKQHKISALECLFLPQNLLLKNSLSNLPFKLDKVSLRSSISEKASHSWVKAKKKFEVEADRNVYIAKKSLFHSLRIIDFGIQIAEHGKIVDYHASKDLWLEIITNPKEDWNSYKDEFQQIFNDKMIKFRRLAPKERK